MRTQDLETIRSELTHRRRRVLEAAERADAELAGLQETGARPEAEESARLLSDKEALVRLGEAERRELARIDGALARIAEGTFGDCVECGEPIEARRLHALPHAMRCQGCEEARERTAAR